MHCAVTFVFFDALCGLYYNVWNVYFKASLKERRKPKWFVDIIIGSDQVS